MGGAVHAAEQPAATRMIRTLELYAAKQARALEETGAIQAEIDGNLRSIQKSMRDFDTLLHDDAIAPWGQHGVAAHLAYLQLLYRDYFELHSEQSQRWTSDGIRIADQLIDRQLDGGGFGLDPRQDELRLWPTALAIRALAQAYASQRSVKYEDAAIAAAEGLEPLRLPDGSYRTATSASHAEVRANAHLADALYLLARNGAGEKWRQRSTAISAWLGGQPESDPAHRREIETLATIHAATRALAPRQVLSPELTAALQRLNLSAPLQQMAQDLTATLVQRLPHLAGDFAYDSADSPGYAIEMLKHLGLHQRAGEIIARIERLAGRPWPKALPELSYGALGLIVASDQAAAAAALRRYLRLTGIAARADGYYLDWLAWISGDVTELGPTVLTAQIAQTHLRAAAVLGDEAARGWIDPLRTGLALLAVAQAEAWDEEQQ
ncbi:MAG TPA: hypothetical protein VEB21_06000, partial [Terriglobales bacterium]|nr:hypothetical protein [Terriglobales bacterium]